jgi:hypothetical protein
MLVATQNPDLCTEHLDLSSPVPQTCVMVTIDDLIFSQPDCCLFFLTLQLAVIPLSDLDDVYPLCLFVHSFVCFCSTGD